MLLLLLLSLLLLMVCDEGQAANPPLDFDAIKNSLNSVADIFAPLYLPMGISSSSPCGRALDDMVSSLASNSSWWAASMVDSWGKAHEGSFVFNYRFYGSFDECVQVAAPDAAVTGKYCVVDTRIIGNKGKLISPPLPQHNPWRPDAPWLRHIYNRDPRTVVSTVGSFDTTYSTCMPSVCTKKDLQDSLNQYLVPQGSVAQVTCYVKDPRFEFTDADIGFTAFFTFLLVLVVCASVFDMYLSYTASEQLNKGAIHYFLVFSGYTNVGKILQVNPKSNPRTITCLHAMRVLSMTWVIYCHQLTIPFRWTANLALVPKAMEGIAAQVISNGYPSVDTFFFLSGLLVSYSVLREAKRAGGLNVPIYYIHRFLRLAPPIGIVAGLVATVMRFFVSGPLTKDWQYSYNSCQKNWWKDLIFVSNLALNGDCIGQAWYLGVDMQLYLIAPIVILPLFFYRRSGEIWLFLLTVASAITPAAIIYKLGLTPTLLQGNDNTGFFDKVYTTPWCRAEPWLAGVWSGYIFFRQGNVRPKMSALMVATGWTLAAITGLLVIFGMYSYNQVFDPAPFDVITQVVYGGAHRLAWGMALAWMVFACHNGYGDRASSQKPDSKAKMEPHAPSCSSNPEHAEAADKLHQTEVFLKPLQTGIRTAVFTVEKGAEEGGWEKEEELNEKVTASVTSL